MAVWGNHSATQYPDITHALVGGRPATELVTEREWIENDFIPTVQQARRGDHRGARARRAPSPPPAPPSTTSTTGSCGTPEGDWVSMGVPSDGSYDVDEGVISGFPCTCSGGEWKIVEGLDIDEFSRERIDASVAELQGERDTVSGLGLV